MSDIIFEDKQGNYIMRDDLSQISKSVDFSLIAKETIPLKARELHQQARQEGQYGNYKRAIELLKQTHLMIPQWPHPLYDMAFTYLLQKEYTKALRYYHQTNCLEPRGFFACKVAIYALEGELKGVFPPGLYLAYLRIDWTNNVREKLEIVTSISQQCPTFAPAWKELAQLLDDKNERIKAIENGLKHNPDVETRGNLLINKAMLLDSEGKTDEAIAILGNLILDKEVTLTNNTWGKFVLAQIVS